MAAPLPQVFGVANDGRRPRAAGDFGRAVRRSVVDDDDGDFTTELVTQPRYDGGNRILRVERGYEHRGIA